MAERIRWRQLHEAAQLEVERLKKELFDAVNNGLSLAKENDELRSKVDDLTKAVERARIVGMNEATGLILRSDNP
jgi:sugar-specific transcriptional regulator TrmB